MRLQALFCLSARQAQWGAAAAALAPENYKLTSGLLSQSSEEGVVMCRMLVEDGAHVEQDVQYAEMEAMKQIMLLTSPASGHIHFQARSRCACCTL